MKNINLVSVLLVENNSDVTKLICGLFKEAENLKFDVNIAESISNAIESISNSNFDVILLDLSLPDADELLGLKKISNVFQNKPIIILTENNNQAFWKNAITEGAQDYLIKNEINADNLNRAINYALEHYKIQTKLAKSEQDWKNIFQAIPHPTIILDANHNIIHLNKIIEQKTGLSAEELKTKKCWQIFHGENTIEPPSGCPFQSLLTMDNDGICEKEMSAFDGTYLVSCKPVKDNDGKLDYVIHIATDITHLKKTEKELFEKDTKYRLFTENAADVLWLLNLKTGKWEFMSPSVERLRGYTVDEVMNQSMQEVMSHDSYEFASLSMSKRIDKLLKDKETDKFYVDEIEQTCKDGTTVWTEVVTRYIFNENGDITLLGISRNIAAKKMLEIQLKENNQKYIELFELGFIAIFLIDCETGNILESNEAATNMYGYTKEEFRKMKNTDVSAEPNETKKVTNETIESEILIPLRYHKRKNGEIFPTEITGRFFTWNNRKVHVAAILDITERVEMIKEKTTLNKILTEKTKELEQIISIAGHDMRSPLVNIQGFSELTLLSLDKLKENILANKLDDENVKEFLKGEIHESLKFVISGSKKINRIIDGLLNVSRLGRSIMTIEKLNVKNLINEILITNTFVINENKIQINMLELPYCYGDKQMIQRLFAMLIENAIKFRKAETPTIIDISADKINNNLVYAIKDNGIGIPEKFKEKIFNIFQKADQQKPGEGLGLALAKKIMEKHDGEIWFESEENSGTTFYVKLPQTK